jgi:hypothetical protein
MKNLKSNTTHLVAVSKAHSNTAGDYWHVISEHRTENAARTKLADINKMGNPYESVGSLQVITRQRYESTQA